MIARAKSKILVIIIIALLAINVFMLIYMLKGHEERGLRNNIKAAIPEFLKNDMNFSSVQMSQFDTFSQEQQEKFKTTMEEMRSSKQGELKALGEAGFSDSAMNNVVAHSLEKQKTFEFQFFQYIKDVRKICTPEQQAKFDTSFYKILNPKK